MLQPSRVFIAVLLIYVAYHFIAHASTCDGGGFLAVIRHLVLDLALAILATMTAAPIRSAGRFSPLGPRSLRLRKCEFGRKK